MSTGQFAPGLKIWNFKIYTLGHFGMVLFDKMTVDIMIDSNYIVN